MQAPGPQRLEHPGLERLRAELRQLGRALAEAEQLQHIGGVPVSVKTDLLQPEAHLAGDYLRRVCLRDPAVRADDIDDRQVRDAAAIREATSFQIGDLPIRKAAPELIQQA